MSASTRLVTWLDAAHVRARDASARVVSAFANLQREQQRLSRELDAVLVRLDNGTSAREQATRAELHERVMSAFRAGSFDTLSLREQRYAAKRFDKVAYNEMQEFLVVHPSNWETFAKECFRRWDEFVGRSNHRDYARLLCLAPPHVAFLHRFGRVQDVVGKEGPSVVARAIDASDVSAARGLLQQYGWNSAWAFTCEALAAWTHLRTGRGESFDSLFSPLSRDLIAEAMLLPRLKGNNRSWFSDVARPAGIRSTRGANARFVAAMLRAALGRGPQSQGADIFWSTFEENLLRSEFHDPRIPPESDGWVAVKRVDERSYRAFLERLVSEDLEIFFDRAMKDSRRRTFWLSYLGSIRRTTCILDGNTYDKVSRQLAGADKKLVAALSRARRFTKPGGTGSAQAFCLYFDNIVVVEFSETGNAAYVYGRAEFEKHFENSIRNNQVHEHKELKVLRRSRTRIIHSSHNWERLAEDLLADLEIYPDPEF